MTQITTAPSSRLLSRLLRPFAAVEPAEAVSVCVLTLAVFLLLTAYYFLKTAREPLILLHGGAEVKSYAAAGQAVLLVGVVRVYAALARRVGRMTLIASVYLFFTANLVFFAALARAGVDIGVPFYLWVGIFSNTVIAQFWSFANDVYSAEQGKRLFAVLGIGSSVGAVAGALIAKRIAFAGPAGLMLAAAVVLVVCLTLFGFVDRRYARLVQSGGERLAAQPLVGEHAFALLLRDRYLILIAALTLLLNLVNSNGEYVVDRLLVAAAEAAAAHGVDKTEFIAAFKADYFGWVNLIGVLLQLFAVSRILTRVGVRNALFVLPAVAFASYSMIALAPVLALVRIGKIAENSLDYSLQNTARQALFLVTSRSEKYVGKAVIDTLVVRVGDVMSAGLVWLAARLALPVAAFATLNLMFIAAWVLALLAIGREHRRRSLVPPAPSAPVLAPEPVA
jgi:AAA family ATP:ADP antiporter